MENGAISLKQFELLAVAINTGTNLPSVATPNGQAAFLFLLTSALAAVNPSLLWPYGLDGVTVHYRTDPDRATVRRIHSCAGHRMDDSGRMVSNAFVTFGRAIHRPAPIFA